MFCQFAPLSDITYQCTNCEIIVTSEDGPPILPCAKVLSRDTNDSPSFIEKVTNFAKATMQHIQTGSPMCTEEQVISRHDICMGCEFYKDDTCSKCGCPLFRTRKFVSKLAWADQECPVGKWGKEIN
jgi:hypothetical protein